MRTFEIHNEKIEKLIGIEYADSTVRRYKSITARLREFINSQNRDRKDMPLRSADQKFFLDFLDFLRAEKGCAQNTIIRYTKYLKKVIHEAQANGLIRKDPFIGIKLRAPKPIIEFLTKDELMAIIHKKFTIPRIELVKDIFVFCCFTGLSFIDVKNLEPSHLVNDNNGNLWVFIRRQKTEKSCCIPLIDIPLQILEKYRGHRKSQKTGKCLPVPSNQITNAYLKEVCDCCGITKRVTTHTARRKFASVVTTFNNIPIERVSELLGHADLRSTIGYTRIFNESVLNDMRK